MRSYTRATALVVALALATLGLTGAPQTTTAAAAEPGTQSTLGLPGSVAVLGDSISQATGANGGGQGGLPGQTRPRNSWATGDLPGLNSNYQRINSLAGGGVQPINLSQNGARVARDLVDQAQQIPVGTDYVLVLMGGNDLCRPTVEEMTSVAEYDAEVNAALTWITANRPNTSIGVVSVPDIYRLWEIRRTNFWAVVFWGLGIIPCQSLLANPTSTSSANMARRAAVRQRGLEYNAVLRARCDEHIQCMYDNDEVWLRTNDPATFVNADISTQDHFHPSYAGQQKLATFTWGALYNWAALATPFASMHVTRDAGTTVVTEQVAPARSLASRAGLRAEAADPPLPTEWRTAPALSRLSAATAQVRAERAVEAQGKSRWQDRYLASVRQAIPTTAGIDDALLLDWPVTLCHVLDNHPVTAKEIAEGLAKHGVDASVAGYVTGAAVAANCAAHAR